MNHNITGKECLNKWDIKDYIRNLLMLAIKIPIWLVQYFLYFIPVQNEKIIIYSLKQKGYSCNLKYLTDHIVKFHNEEYQLLWVVKDQEDCERLKKHRIIAVKRWSWKHFVFRMRAGIILTNDEFYPMFIKRKKQIYINTWHGGINYKKIGYSGIYFTNYIQKLIFKLNNPEPDIFISGSRSFTKSTAEAFRFSEHIFLPSGLPRNDIFFHCQFELSQSIRERLDIRPQTKLLLYSPTFRKGKTGPVSMLNYTELIKTLELRFGGKWKILIRQHYFVECTNHKDFEAEEVIDVSNYEDMQELILISDCMISDYSSCMWDFSFTGRPCFVYAPDLYEYLVSDRSIGIALEKWPYPICCNENELFLSILHFDNDSYQEKVKIHHQNMGSYEHGNACEQILNELQKRKEV